MLRVASANAKVEPLIDASGLRATVVFRKGQPKFPGGTTVSRGSGFNVEVSRADADLERQVRDAIRFLERHRAGLLRLRRCRGFKGMTLDFGLEGRRSPERPWPSYRLPGRLIECAGKHGIQIDLTFYM